VSIQTSQEKKYHDFASIPDEQAFQMVQKTLKGVPDKPFPVRLHKLLERAEIDGYSHIISWLPHGRAFIIDQPQKFIQEVANNFFLLSKYSSFQRQLCTYGFRKLSFSEDFGAYCHEFFIRGRPGLSRGIRKSNRKVQLNPLDDPNFYEFPPVDDTAKAALKSRGCSSKNVQSEVKDSSSK